MRNKDFFICATFPPVFTRKLRASAPVRAKIVRRKFAPISSNQFQGLPDVVAHRWSHRPQQLFADNLQCQPHHFLMRIALFPRPASRQFAPVSTIVPPRIDAFERDERMLAKRRFPQPKSSFAVQQPSPRRAGSRAVPGPLYTAPLVTSTSSTSLDGLIKIGL